jgi:hypothetical protein
MSQLQALVGDEAAQPQRSRPSPSMSRYLSLIEMTASNRKSPTLHTTGCLPSKACAGWPFMTSCLNSGFTESRSCKRMCLSTKILTVYGGVWNQPEFYASIDDTYLSTAEKRRLQVGMLLSRVRKQGSGRARNVNSQFALIILDECKPATTHHHSNRIVTRLSALFGRRDQVDQLPLLGLGEVIAGK